MIPSSSIRGGYKGDLKLIGPNSPRLDARFFDEWNEYSAYVFGFALADGCIVGNGKTKSLTFCVNDLDILEQIKAAMRVTSGIHKHGNQYVLAIGNSYLLSRIQQLGIHPRKTKSLFQVFIPAPSFRHFVRGYFDGDGYIRWNGKSWGVHLHTVETNRFGEILEPELAIQGLPVPTVTRPKSQTCRMEIFNWYGRNVYGILNWMYEGQTICGSRKLQRVKEALQFYRDKAAA